MDRPHNLAMRRQILIVVLSLLVWSAAALAPAPAATQDVQRIAALVNDDVISGFDVERRVELVMRTTRMKDTPENRRRLRAQVLEILIDEKLQLQAAEMQNLKVSDSEMQSAISQIEQRNRVSPGRFDSLIRSMGIDRDTLLQQIRSRLAWNKVVLRKLQPIPDEEIDEALAKAKADVGMPEYRISEILIPIDSPERENDARLATEELRAQINGGVPFAAAAREFSRGATAADGGAVGWVMADQLDPVVGNTLADMRPGDVSEPIRTTAGYYLIQLHENRRFLSAEPGEATLQLRQVLFAVPESPSRAQLAEAETEARDFASAVEGCDDLEAAAQRNDRADYIDLGELKLSQLAEAIRPAVAPLDVGKVSAPVATAAGVVLMAVCGRQEPEVPRGLDRDAVLRELTQKHMAQVAQRYIRDLRRDAVVEYR